jgi:hypothetical protein
VDRVNERLEFEDAEAAHLERYGLCPPADRLPSIRAILRGEIARESSRQGDGNTRLMRLCCVQLFWHGDLADVFLIWQAKGSSFDAACSIEIQLLCGSGLVPVQRYLRERGTIEASGILERLLACEAAGDFLDFTPTAFKKQLAGYYGVRCDE